MATTKKANSDQTTNRKPATKKPVTKKAAAKKAPARKTAETASKPQTTAPTGMSAENRYKMIQETAYFLAEKDGFRADPTSYWTAAEAQISARA